MGQDTQYTALSDTPTDEQQQQQQKQQPPQQQYGAPVPMGGTYGQPPMQQGYPSAPGQPVMYQQPPMVPGQAPPHIAVLAPRCQTPMAVFPRHYSTGFIIMNVVSWGILFCALIGLVVVLVSIDPEDGFNFYYLIPFYIFIIIMGLGVQASRTPKRLKVYTDRVEVQTHFRCFELHFCELEYVRLHPSICGVCIFAPRGSFTSFENGLEMTSSDACGTSLLFSPADPQGAYTAILSACNAYRQSRNMPLVPAPGLVRVDPMQAQTQAPPQVVVAGGVQQV